MSATAPALPRPRFALRRWQILTIGWSIPVALIGTFVATNVVATSGQRGLRAQWDEMVARSRLDAAALSAHPWAAGEPIARIAIRAIGLDVVVVEGGGGAERRAPAHLPSSAAPGTPGTAVVTGGRFGYGSFFLGLERLRAGDEIVAETLAGLTRYIVSSVEVLPESRLGLDRDSTTPALVLVTGSRAWSDGDRLVVRAEASKRENLR